MKGYREISFDLPALGNNDQIIESCISEAIWVDEDLFCALAEVIG